MATPLRLGMHFLVGCVVFLTFHCHALAAQGLMSGHSSAVSTQRHLLQVKSPCPIVFSDVNYSSVTSVCKADVSDSSAQEVCCNAFLSLSCTYATYLNNANTTCSNDFFSYLNLAGGYRSGYFPNLCQYLGDRFNGYQCPLTPAPAPNPSRGCLLEIGIAALIATVGIHLLPLL